MILAVTLFLSACNNDDDTSDLDPKPQAFIATNDSFAGFQSWELVAEQQGPDPAPGAAHAGNDSTATRHVYFKNDQDRVNGAYPVGTIIVKASHNPDLIQTEKRHALVKV
ncbi:MAG: hypothetical protein KQI35_09785 [Bacteroidetes bacterium]|nr:hypothetical protein [Bacteroidota bacterium]